MSIEKKTKRMYFEELKEIVATVTEAGDAQDDMLEFLDKQLELLDNRAKAAAKRAEQKRQESDDLMDKIYDVIGDEYVSVDDILEALEDVEGLTRNKVTARLGKLYKQGKIDKDKIKVEGSSNKRMGYIRADKTEDVAEDGE